VKIYIIAPSPSHSPVNGGERMTYIPLFLMMEEGIKGEDETI
jgi:hypothetical protein